MVDGVWINDKDADVVDDSVGGYNNILEVLPVKTDDADDLDLDEYTVCIQTNLKNFSSNHRIVKIKYLNDVKWVSIKGSWDDWKKEIPLKKVKDPFTGNNEFYVNLKIIPGSYIYKLLIDGKWTVDPLEKTIIGSDGYENNLLVVKATVLLNSPKPISFEDSTLIQWKLNQIDSGIISYTFQGHSMDAVAENIYIFGGITNGQFTNSMFILDTNTMEISCADQVGNIPTPRAFHRYTYLNSYIY